MNIEPLSESTKASQRHSHLSRRRFLRGVGACIALPTLGSLLPRTALADIAVGPAGPLATSATGAPIRMAFCYIPNGTIPSVWWPEGEGKDFKLNQTMEPLANVQSMIQSVGGLDCQNATPGPDGPGDHARASGSFLTGVRVKKTAGADIHAGISIDQIAANQIGHLTRFPSLELSCDAVRRSGSCDSGYSCAYQYNLAWRSPTNPLSPEINPRLLFERLFGDGAPGQRKASLERRQAQQRSILDFVLGEVDSLQPQLGTRDKQKVDEYLTSIREIEKRIEKSEQFASKTPDPDVDTPAGIPTDFGDYIDLMYDMMILAFQTDQTRVATFLLANEGSNRTFSEVGFSEGHHYLTHHKNNPEMIDKVKVIDRWYMQHFARFLEKMNQTKDSDGHSLLHNSMIVYGSGNADGNRHTHSNLPIILAGAAGGAITPGRAINYGSVPITNMFLSMTDRLGCTGVKSFGDSTGRVEGL
jgi:hypothetical protein